MSFNQHSFNQLHKLPQQITKKVSTSAQKKTLSFHFDKSQDMQTQVDKQQSIAQYKMKRQNELLQQQKHQKISKKYKKNEVLQENQISHHKNQQQYGFKNKSSYGIGNIVINRGKQSLNKQFKPSINHIKQDSEFIQRKTLQLLRELLFHPDKKNKCIINTQVANKWIIDDKIPTKIRSFLILYMILYQFQSIEFKFNQIISEDAQQSQQYKLITIVYQSNKLSNNFSNHDLNKNQEYQRFKNNQIQKYLAQYLQWLISKNYYSFPIQQGNQQFWAMALNDNQKVASQLILQQNTRYKQRNVFLSLFLLNAEDIVFRSTLEIPKNQKIILYMQNQSLQMLPKCHWLLGLNFSVRYFYKKQFNERVRQSLNIVGNINGVDDSSYEQVRQYYHEYQMLSRYFNDNNSNVLKNSYQQQSQKEWSLSDKILQWIGINSDCRTEDYLQYGKEQNGQNKQLVGNKYKIQQRGINYNNRLNRQICSILLKSTLLTRNRIGLRTQNINNRIGLLQNENNNNNELINNENNNEQLGVQQILLIVIQLLQRQLRMNDEQKDNIISSILYRQQKIAHKLNHSNFIHIINKLYHKHQTILPKLFQRLNHQYSNIYSHLLLSQQQNLKNDLLTQLKYLIKINFNINYQNNQNNTHHKVKNTSVHNQVKNQVKNKIYHILSSFNLITHWNKQVLRTFIYLIDQYIHKLSLNHNNINNIHTNSIEQQPNSSSLLTLHKNYQIQQISTLSTFLKIHINLLPLNIHNLTQIINLTKPPHKIKSKQRKIIPFQSRTISFIQKDILSILFAKNGFNQVLLSEIKKSHIYNNNNNEFIEEQKSNQKNLSQVTCLLNQSNNLLQDLKQAAKGIKYFKDQINLLQKQANAITYD